MADKEYVNLVYRTIQELTEQHGVAKRDEIAIATNLKKSIIDECIKDLVEDSNKVVKLRAGVCVPAKTFEEFPCTLTEIEDGRVKGEWGDQMFLITPKAARTFAKMLAGYVLLYGKA